MLSEPLACENIFAGVFLESRVNSYCLTGRCCPTGEGVSKPPPVGENIFAGVFHESRVNSYCPIGEMREPKIAVPRRIILEPWARHSRQSPLMPIERCSMFVSCAFARS